jgi:peptide/nickel transport system substrate-binding protein
MVPTPWTELAATHANDARRQRLSLRAAWLDAPNKADRTRIAEQVQIEFFKFVPFIPVGQYFQPATFRSDLSGFVRAPFSVFWGVKRD